MDIALTALAALGYALSFVLLWVVVLWVMAYATGWRRLMGVYPSRPLQFPTCWNGQHLTLRKWGGYNGVVIACADGEAVTFDLPRLFRIGHAPITIPWHEITVVATKKRSVTFQTQRAPTVSIAISRDLAAKFDEVSNGRFSNQPIIFPD